MFPDCKPAWGKQRFLCADLGPRARHNVYPVQEREASERSGFSFQKCLGSSGACVSGLKQNKQTKPQTRTNLNKANKETFRLSELSAYRILFP